MVAIETEVAVMKEQIAEVKADTEEIKSMIRDSVKPRLLEHDKDIAMLKVNCSDLVPKINTLWTDVAVLKNNWMIFTGITAAVASAAVFLIDHFLG